MFGMLTGLDQHHGAIGAGLTVDHHAAKFKHQANAMAVKLNGR